MRAPSPSATTRRSDLRATRVLVDGDADALQHDHGQHRRGNQLTPHPGTPGRYRRCGQQWKPDREILNVDDIRKQATRSQEGSGFITETAGRTPPSYATLFSTVRTNAKPATARMDSRGDRLRPNVARSVPRRRTTTLHTPIGHVDEEEGIEGSGKAEHHRLIQKVTSVPSQITNARVEPAGIRKMAAASTGTPTTSTTTAITITLPLANVYAGEHRRECPARAAARAAATPSATDMP